MVKYTHPRRVTARMGILESTQVSVAESAQILQNSILQDSKETCIANCTNYNGGGTIIINGTSIAGNVDIVQQCSATTSCVMNQQLTSQVQNIVSAIAEQDSKAEQSFLNFTINTQADVTNTRQYVRNTVTQILDSACQASSRNIQIDNLVVLEQDNIGGNLILGQEGSATANCVMNNLAKQVIFNQAQTQSNQDETVTSSLVVALIAIAVVVVVLILVIVVVYRATKKDGSKIEDIAPYALL